MPNYPEIEMLINDQSLACPNITSIMSDSWDGDDIHGSNMAEAFAICDFMMDNGMGHAIPEELDYRPSACGSDTEDYRYQDLEWYSTSNDPITEKEFVEYLKYCNRIYTECEKLDLVY